MQCTSNQYIESQAYFTKQKNRASKYEQEYLPHLYTRIADNWAMACDDTLLGMVLQRKEHIDAVLLKRGKFYYIEHKFDFYKQELEGRPRNVVIETIMNTRRNLPGWYLTTRADYILFAFERPPIEGCLEVYLVTWPALKKWFLENEHQYREHTNYNKPNPSTFRLVPIADIQRAMHVTSYRIYRTGIVESIQDTEPIRLTN